MATSVTAAAGNVGAGPGGRSEDYWSESDTTPDRIASAMRKLLRERHAANEALAPARVLNLVVIVDRDWKGEIANRLARVGRYHPSRTVLCAVEEGRTTLDAWATISYEEPRHGFGVILERVEIDLGPEHLKAIETIVDPVVVSDLPTVLWSPHGHEDAVEDLLDLTDVVLFDSDDDSSDPAEGLSRASELLNSVYVVDLAWLRTTPWRERLAASFDLPTRRRVLTKLDGLKIRHRATSEASALLLAGWLVSRLHWEPRPLQAIGDQIRHGSAQRNGDKFMIELLPTDQNVPGLAGVTVACGDAFTLSLDRARGGLRAEQATDGDDRVWQVLGASRGEGGILGEGIRQAHLRDPTYGPALAAARVLCSA